MSIEVKHRRGTTSEHSAFTGALGEITVDIDKKTAVVHDGSTAGGFPLAHAMTITANSDASPTLGTVANNNEYRCTNTSLTTAPTMTLAAIASASTEFACAIIFKAPNATAPVVTNNSGYTLKYSGQDVLNGTWTPIAATVYRMSIVFDGICVNIYVSGAS